MNPRTARAILMLSMLGVALPTAEPEPPPDPDRERRVRPLPPLPLRPVMPERHPGRLADPNACPDNCGTTCKLHGKRNAKLARRAARSAHAALVLVWVCEKCGPVARSVLRHEGDHASCPWKGCWGFATVQRVAPEVAKTLPPAPDGWTGAPF